MKRDSISYITILSTNYLIQPLLTSVHSYLYVHIRLRIFRMAIRPNWNNCYNPSKHLLVLKTSSAPLQCNNFTSSKASWRHLAKRLEDVLKTCLEDMSYWGYLYLTNLNLYPTNLYFTNLYLTILRRIQNALIRTQ